MPNGEFPRPAFIDAVGHSYNRRGKRVILLTGNVLDQFWSPQLGNLTPLEQTLYCDCLSRVATLQGLCRLG